MNSFFARWLPCVTLATWSGVLLFYHQSDRMRDLLAPQFRVFALIAGVVLALMALVFALFKADASCCSANDCGHGLSRLNAGKLLTFAVLIFPLTLAAKFNPGEYSVNAVKNATVSTDASSLGGASKARQAKLDAAREADVIAKGKISEPPPLPLPVAPGSQPPEDANAKKHPADAGTQTFADYLQRSSDGNIIAEVLDLLYAAQDQVLRKDFEGKKVELVVQYMPESSGTGGAKRFKGVRMFMTCCAADARPIATMIEADKLPDFPEMTWVKITGTATFPVEKGRRISVLKAEKIEKSKPPEDNMLY